MSYCLIDSVKKGLSSFNALGTGSAKDPLKSWYNKGTVHHRTVRALGQAELRPTPVQLQCIDGGINIKECYDKALITDPKRLICQGFDNQGNEIPILCYGANGTDPTPAGTPYTPRGFSFSDTEKDDCTARPQALQKNQDWWNWKVCQVYPQGVSGICVQNLDCPLPAQPSSDTLKEVGSAIGFVTLGVVVASGLILSYHAAKKGLDSARSWWYGHHPQQRPLLTEHSDYSSNA